jgi:hypothetical protein
LSDTKPTPCPFCGTTDLKADWGHNYAFMACDSCGAIGPDAPIQTGDQSTFADQTSYRAAALAAWDRRAPDPRLARLIGRCEVIARLVRGADLHFIAGRLAEAIEEAKQDAKEQAP